jgi:hypothetical protein
VSACWPAFSLVNLAQTIVLNHQLVATRAPQWTLVCQWRGDDSEASVGQRMGSAAGVGPASDAGVDVTMDDDPVDEEVSDEWTVGEQVSERAWDCFVSC